MFIETGCNPDCPECRSTIQLPRTNPGGVNLQEAIQEEIQMDGEPRLDGKKFDEGKPQLGLVARSLIWGIGKIMTFGAVKYGRDQWRGGMEWHRPYDALQRHLTAWWDGEDKDLETGESHLYHAACELMFLIEYEAKGTGKDDRYKGTK